MRTVLSVVVVLGALLAVAALRYVGIPDALVPGWLAGPVCTVSTADGEIALEPDVAQALTDVGLAEAAAGADTTRWRDRARAALTQAVEDGRLTRADRTAAQAALRTADAALACRLTAAERHDRATTLHREDEGPQGLTPRAEAVRRALLEAGGDLPLGGYAPGGVSTGHMPGSAHYEGRAIDVFFRPVDAESSRHGWLLAQWLVAHADTLDVHDVIFDDRIWNATTSSAGWKPYLSPRGPTRDPVLRHLDHVHVDVPRGS